jgi:hypothetical protein
LVTKLKYEGTKTTFRDKYVAYPRAYKSAKKISFTTFCFFDIGISHRASIIEIVTLLFEPFSAVLSFVEFVSITFRPLVKAGCLGVGRGACSLLIIETTSGMVGRSVGLSWTQRRPMLMNLNRTEVEEGYPIVGSNNSKLRSSIHSSQALLHFKSD